MVKLKKRKKPKKWNQAKAKRKLDHLFSQVILARDERTCQWCGRGVPEVKVDTSHCIPRENLGLRWSVSNAIGVCFSCHKRRGKSWHGSPLEAVKWLRALWGDAHCDMLIEKAKLPFEFNAESAAIIEADLKEKLASLAGVLTTK